GRAGAFELDCAWIFVASEAGLKPCATTAGFVATTRGFGNPSSVTFAVSVTGDPIATFVTGAIVITGGLLGSSSPGFRLPRVWMIRSVISSTGSSVPYALFVLPFAVIVHVTVPLPKFAGTRTR